jgi:predicted 2-oxoglutarate/Fe(II)-dependent dioxygenase YbiX
MSGSVPAATEVAGLTGTVPPALFAQLGVVVIPDFLSPDLARRLRRDAGAATTVPATVWRDARDSEVNLDARRTGLAQVDSSATALIRSRLEAVRPTLEGTFRLHTLTWQPIQFLVYRAGDYFRAHRDDSDLPDAYVEFRCRRVSVVVFLSGQGPHVEDFGGGELVFYDLIPDARWKGVGIPLTPRPGMLVAFRSDCQHAVTPIERGVRCSVVTWLADPVDARPPVTSA